IFSLRSHTTRALTAVFFAAIAGATSARGDAVDIDARAKEAAKSIVIVDFTLRNENSSREDSGQGILLNKEGVVLIAGGLISETLPKEWTPEIKVRQPDKNFEAVPARMLGRTRNRLFAYLKTEKPLDAAPFAWTSTKDVALGQPVFSVALSSKDLGYTTYIG